MIDARLKNTKCADCLNGHYFILEETEYAPCADCKDRPNRNRDKSRFVPDIKSEWLKDLLDEDAAKETKFDY